MADLFINGEDALAVYGVRMGDKFLSSLGAPAPLKTPIENDSRALHGKQILASSARVGSRQITLEFTIQGVSPSDFKARKDAFFELLYNGELYIEVPSLGSEVYRLWFLGTSPIYSLSRNRCFCKVSVKFEEPDPTFRN